MRHACVLNQDYREYPPGGGIVPVVAYAVVDRDGTLRQHSNATTAQRIGQGEYHVAFTVANAAAIVQIVSNADVGNPSVILSAFGEPNTLPLNTVHVKAYDSGGNGVDTHFQLLIVE
jgi:hypothetical protein